MSSGPSGRALRRGTPPRAWGEPPPSLPARIATTLRRWLGGRDAEPRRALPELPLALRHGQLAAGYLSAEQAGDHRGAGAASLAAMEAAAARLDWWPADIWGHRALWHFEQADLALQAIRASRLIGDVRSAAGDPASARRYYAEAIAEARDVGAEQEQGLASLGLGRALLHLGDVTAARRLGTAAVELLERAGAPPGEIESARGLRGVERAVGEGSVEEDG